MKNNFEIPVTHKGRDLTFNASVKAFGYVPKIEVDVNGQMIIFEQDEEGNYRGVTSFDSIINKPTVDVELIGLIAELLNTVKSTPNH